MTGRVYQFHTTGGLTNPMDEELALEWLKKEPREILGLIVSETMRKKDAIKYLKDFGIDVK